MTPDLRRDPQASRFRGDWLHFSRATLMLAGFPQLGRRFVLWRFFPPRRPGGKPAKLPVSTWGQPIDGTDERNWLDFHQAATYAVRCGLGLGVGLGWGFCGLDLDHCVDADGKLSDTVRLILRHFPTYIELSPSRTGVKAYFLAAPSFRTTAKNDARGIELYAGRRFFALTGGVFSSDPLNQRVVSIADCTAPATLLGNMMRPPTPPQAARPPAPSPDSAQSRLEACEPKRERPSLHGGTVYTLSVCPFTGESHQGGGPYAIVFLDGAVFFRCDRSSHGPQREWVRPVTKAN